MTDEFIRENIEPIVSTSSSYGFGGSIGRLAKKLGGWAEGGASRICIILPNDNEVVKITLLDNTTYDYSAREYQNYKTAEKYGIQDVLLPIRKFNNYENGASIYIQPKYRFSHTEADGQWLNKKINSTTYSRILKSATFNGIYRHFYRNRVNRHWFMFVYAKYGKKFCRSLVQWTHDYQVNDLHSSNVGYLHGNPIILDYAGYFGDNGPISGSDSDS